MATNVGLEGEPCVVANAIDITEWKRTQEALADMGRKLIGAHEEERTFIARELHDDIGQRIALLAVEPVRSCVTAAVGRSSRFNSCWAMHLFRQRNDTSGVSRISGTQ